MAKEKTALSEITKELLQRNGKVLTFFAVILIIGVGIAVIDNPANWWYSIIAILAFLVVVLLFLNARAFVKGVVSILLLFILGGYSFKFGASLDRIGAGGSVWMSITFAVFFINLSISYFWQTTKSRWGSATLASIVGFITTFFLATFNIPVSLSALIAGIGSIALFVLIYFYGKGARYRPEMMPIIGGKLEFVEQFVDGMKDSKWESFANFQNGKNSIVVFNEDHAFHLMPVTLEDGFSGDLKKKPQLIYRGFKVAPWLLQTSFSSALKKVSNADAMLILLDVDNKNGKESRVIGVDTPDSLKKIPVGIIPARKIALSPSASSSFLDEIEKNFSDFVSNLTDKQKKDLRSKIKVSLEENN